MSNQSVTLLEYENKTPGAARGLLPPELSALREFKHRHRTTNDMNEAHESLSSNACSPLGLLLVIGLCCWCWLGRGPRVLGWPLLVIFVLMTSGHQAGEIVSVCMGGLAEPVLTLLIVIGGLLLILRGFGFRQRRTYRPDYREGGWRNDRW